MNTNYLKILLISLCLSTLLGVMACATGGGGGSLAPSTDHPQQNDPEFWKTWQDSRGLG